MTNRSKFDIRRISLERQPKLADTVNALIEAARGQGLPTHPGEFDSAGESVVRGHLKTRHTWFFAKHPGSGLTVFHPYSVIELDDIEIDAEGVLTLIVKSVTGAPSAVLVVNEENQVFEDAGGWVRFVIPGVPFRARVLKPIPTAFGSNVGPYSATGLLDDAHTGLVFLGHDPTIEPVDPSTSDVCWVVDVALTSSGAGGSAGSGSPWTTAEHDPLTGDVVAKFDRGLSRAYYATTAGAAVDYDVALDASETKLLTNGSATVARNSGIGARYDLVAETRDWFYELGSIPSNDELFFNGTLPVLTSKYIIEASDGFIWFAVTGAAVRVDPDDGLVTHRVLITGPSIPRFFPSSLAGAIVSWFGLSSTSARVSVLKDDGTSAADLTGVVYTDVQEGAGKIVTMTATDIASWNSNDLSAISSGTPTGGNLGSLATDGTTVWVFTNEATRKVRAFAIGALAAGSELFNANSPAQVVRFAKYNPIDGNVYLQAGSNLYQIDPTTGATNWTASLNAVSGRNAIAFGSDFVVVITELNNGENVTCFETVDGTIRWEDFIFPALTATGFSSSHGKSVIVASDDRVFISSVRRGP